MVDAALVFTSDDKTAATYKDSDDARMAILNTLNWFEAHDEYKWPVFARIHLDFSQIMRFRRALVSDVFVSLQRAGKVRILRGQGDLGTPDSIAERVGKRKRKSCTGRYNRSKRKSQLTVLVVSRHPCKRKRLCKREDGSDIEIEFNDPEKSNEAGEEFLTDSMINLIIRARMDPSGVLSENRGPETPEELADMVHDGLVSVWDGPVANHDLVPEELERKQALWNQSKASTVRE